MHPRIPLATALVLVFAAPAARAHFILEEPASFSEQGILGDPQKAPPCGDDPSQPLVETGLVTQVQSGTALEIAISEKVFHPGHYRVSLAADMDSLPPDPEVTPGTTACGSTVIETSPVLPLLADGLLVHTTGFDRTQVVNVTIPADFTCDHCVLQVSEFMSNHGLNNPGGCWYHHCAMLKVTKDPVPDGVEQPRTPGSCQCGALDLSLLALLPLLRRRR